MRKHLLTHSNKCNLCGENNASLSKRKFKLHYCTGKDAKHNHKNFKLLQDSYYNLASQPLRRLFMIHEGKLCCSRCKNKNLEYERLNGGIKPYMFDVDHIKPLKDGGDHSKDNLQLLCFNCHRFKSAIENKKK